MRYFGAVLLMIVVLITMLLFSFSCNSWRLSYTSVTFCATQHFFSIFENYILPELRISFILQYKGVIMLSCFYILLKNTIP